MAPLQFDVYTSSADPVLDRRGLIDSLNAYVKGEWEFA